MPKRTYKPSKVKKKRRSGFRVRSQNKKGKKVLKNRRTKGRKKISS